MNCDNTGYVKAGSNHNMPCDCPKGDAVLDELTGGIVKMYIRNLFVFIFKMIDKLDSLIERAEYTVIGSTGNISTYDEKIAEARKLKPLNRFEKWLLNPFIIVEQRRRRECYRQAVIEAAGEVPNYWQ